MTNVIHLESPAQLRSDAAAWVSKFDAGLSDTEEMELKTWLEGSPLRQQYLLQAATILDDMDCLAVLSEFLPLDETPRPSPYRRPRLVAAGLATLATVCILGLLLVLPHIGPQTPALLTDTSTSFQTQVGEASQAVLPDGSLIKLNTNSHVTVEFSQDYRTLHLLRGEAYFEVAHDAARPFRVHAGSSTVEATGTAFNIKLEEDNRLEVTVIDGQVKIDYPVEAFSKADQRQPQVTVEVRQMATFDHQTMHITELEPRDLDIQTAWQRGIIIFRGDSLESALNEISRYNTTRFEFADPELRELRVAGYFRTGDIDGLLLNLQNNFNVESRRMESGVVILSRSD